jgi:four helix bundle protein
MTAAANAQRAGTGFAERAGMFDPASIDRLEARTRQFAVAAIRLRRQLETSQALWNATGQLVRAAGSVASNHRAMRRARSRREFAAKLQTVVEEADESVLWLQIIDDVRPHTANVRVLLEEATELRAIFVKARYTTRHGTGDQPTR